MMVQTRRKNKAVISSTGISVETVYCRKCRQNKSPAEFYTCVDKVLDTNGYLSLCKLCCRDIYDGFYLSEKSIERAMLKTCRLLNIRYDENAIEAAKQQVETMKARGTESDNFFGLYKSRLLTSAKLCIQSDRSEEDLTFQEGNIIITPTDPLEDHDKNAEELKEIWGDQLNYEDYVWAEKEYSKWEHDYDIRNSSEVNLLRLIILKLLDIRKIRNGGQGSTAKLEKEFQDLLKTSALSPAQSNAASKGNLADTWGMLIKRVEEDTPAEYYKDFELFSDSFNLKRYIKNYISRPISNFFNGQKNYNIIDDPDFSFDASVFGSESSSNNISLLNETENEKLEGE